MGIYTTCFLESETYVLYVASICPFAILEADFFLDKKVAFSILSLLIVLTKHLTSIQELPYEKSPPNVYASL